MFHAISNCCCYSGAAAVAVAAFESATNWNWNNVIKNNTLALHTAADGIGNRQLQEQDSLLMSARLVRNGWKKARARATYSVLVPRLARPRNKFEMRNKLMDRMEKVHRTASTALLSAEELQSCGRRRQCSTNVRLAKSHMKSHWEKCAQTTPLTLNEETDRGWCKMQRVQTWEFIITYEL